MQRIKDELNIKVIAKVRAWYADYEERDLRSCSVVAESLSDLFGNIKRKAEEIYKRQLQYTDCVGVELAVEFITHDGVKGKIVCLVNAAK